MRIVRMRDQRNARGPEARIVFGAGDFLAEFRRELAMHGRAMHADFLEHAPADQRHHAAAARCAGMIGALPWRARETAGGRIAKRRLGGQGVLQRLKRLADIVAKRLEPGLGAGLAGFDWCGIHRAHLIPRLALAAPRSPAAKLCPQSRSKSATAAS